MTFGVLVGESVTAIVAVPSTVLRVVLIRVVVVWGRQGRDWKREKEVMGQAGCTRCHLKARIDCICLVVHRRERELVSLVISN